MVDRSALIVGSFLSALGGRRSVCEDLADQLEGAGWRIQRTSKNPRRIFRLADMCVTVLSRRNAYRVAQVDVFSGKAFIWAEAVCFLLATLGKPYVLTLHGGRLPEFAQTRQRRVRRLLRSAAAVVAPSEYLRSAFAHWQPDIEIIPNPLPLSRYIYRLRHRPAPHLAWVRSFHHMYDPLTAVDVVHRLRDRWLGIHLTMVGPDRGDGSLAAVRQRIADLGLQASIAVIPGIPPSEVPAVLGRADIFLNTTTIDNTPVSVLEAMASGLCVVSTNAGGLRHLLKDGEDALLASPGDTGALAAAVERILVEDGLAGRLSKSARAAVEALDWSSVLPRWEALLRVIGRAGDATTPLLRRPVTLIDASRPAATSTTRH